MRRSTADETGEAITWTRQRLREAECWIFDLDNCLYHHSINLFAQIDRRMKLYIARLLDLPEEAAFKVQKQYFRDFGTTLRGLMKLHDIDPFAFLDFVHDVDMDLVLPDPILDQALAALSGRKVVFTNADKTYANRVLERLGIARHMSGLFDITQAAFIPKPEPQAYLAMTETLGVDPASAVMVEDMARNLIPAKNLGMGTVWVETGSSFASDGLLASHIDARTENLSGWLANLTSAPPSSW